MKSFELALKIGKELMEVVNEEVKSTFARKAKEEPDVPFTEEFYPETAENKASESKKHSDIHNTGEELFDNNEGKRPKRRVVSYNLTELLSHD